MLPLLPAPPQSYSFGSDLPAVSCRIEPTYTLAALARRSTAPALTRRPGSPMPTTMKFLLLPLGTAGDVHPFLGVGRVLRARGHHVTVITNGHFEPLSRSLGLEFIALGTEQDYQRVLADPDLWHPLRCARVLTRWGLPLIPHQFEIIRQHHEPGQTIVVSGAGALGARIAHDKLGVPLATLFLQPGLIPSIYQSPVLPPLPPLPRLVPRFVRRLLYWGLDRVAQRLLGPAVNTFRGSLGLPPAYHLLSSYWFAPQLVVGMFPDWFGPPQPDWPLQIRLAGFPLYDGRVEEQLARKAEEFLQGGEPPIIFTPGTGMKHGQSFFRAAVQACRQLGRRGLLLTRYAEQVPTALPASVCHFAYLPLGQLLPRAAALVHHGGVGTVSQALAAGVPQLIRPVAYDQPDNALRVQQLGVGDWLSPRAFRAPAVGRKLHRLLTSPAVAECCRASARRLAGVEALPETCRMVEQLA
jgi:UDP:flavonoid glycosyltransferase YjiC (YdhE family)